MVLKLLQSVHEAGFFLQYFQVLDNLALDILFAVKLGEKANDKDFAELNIRYHEFHPEWNYVIMHRQL